MTVCPSFDFAITVVVNVPGPATEVSSCPGEVEPLQSVHDWIPGPFGSSAQENDVGTCWFRLYVWLLAGEPIVAVGRPITV